LLVSTYYALGDNSEPLFFDITTPSPSPLHTFHWTQKAKSLALPSLHSNLALTRDTTLYQGTRSLPHPSLLGESCIQIDYCRGTKGKGSRSRVAQAPLRLHLSLHKSAAHYYYFTHLIPASPTVVYIIAGVFDFWVSGSLIYTSYTRSSVCLFSICPSATSLSSAFQPAL